MSGVEIEVEAALVEVPGWGSLLGRRGGERVVAVGAVGRRASIPEGALWRVPDGVGREEALLLPFVAAAEDVAVGLRGAGRVGVRAPFPSAPAVAAALRAAKIEVAAGEASGPPLDGFVGGGEPASWGPGLARVRPGGEVRLLLPPGPARADFDFYSRVHTRSLHLRALRTPRPPRPGDDAGLLLGRARELLKETGLAVEDGKGSLWDLRQAGGANR
ncbi:MAG: hypothetical protein QXO51_05295 [Halobacteria archaeon]